MSSTESLQKILQRVVKAWLDQGLIVRESQAWARMAEMADGLASREKFRQMATGISTAEKQKTFDALARVTGEDIPTLVIAAKKWRRPPDARERKIRELERTIAQLQAELEETKAQAEALPPIVDIVTEKLGTRNTLREIRDRMDESSAEVVEEIVTDSTRRAR